MEQREIKFRVWNSAKQEWVKPIYEAYKGNLYDVSISLGGQIIERTLKCCSDIRNTNDFIISQYTGLKDKNGKEIYFQDLVKAPSGNVFEVVWHSEEMRIALFKNDTYYNFNVPLYEVTGNIYQDKHLIN